MCRFTGKSPFKARDVKSVIELNKSGRIRLNWSSRSSEAKKALKMMLKKEPAERVSIQEVFSLDWVRKRTDEPVIGVSRVPVSQKGLGEPLEDLARKSQASSSLKIDRKSVV